MKADIDATGVLTLTPETGIEAYAMRKWAENNHRMFSEAERRYRSTMHFEEETHFFSSGGLLVKTEIPQEGA